MMTSAKGIEFIRTFIAFFTVLIRHPILLEIIFEVTCSLRKQNYLPQMNNTVQEFELSLKNCNIHKQRKGISVLLINIALFYFDYNKLIFKNFANVF